jgi:hypothetical protein
MPRESNQPVPSAGRSPEGGGIPAGNTSEQAEAIKFDWKFFWLWFAYGLGLVAIVVSPLFIGRYLRHAWGLGMAILNVCGYVWWGLRWPKGLPIASTNPFMWLLELLMLLLVATVELTELVR